MTTWQIVLGVLLFAAATAVLYVWGLRKSMTQEGDLHRLLTGKCAGKVMHYLKSHDTITRQKMVELVNGVTAGQFWSKKKVAVQEPKEFAKQLTEFMLSQQMIEVTGKGSYRLKK